MRLGLITTVMMFMASIAIAQHAHSSNAATETGQSQFAAIAEIVALLRNDPDTDWENVNIGSLRDHLVDMDNVTTKAVVETIVKELRVSFVVSGEATFAKSIQRMVLAHSPMLHQETGWSITAVAQTDGATMSVLVSSIDEINQVTGLGFFGLMTIGAHHQEHHQMIAKGHSPH